MVPPGIRGNRPRLRGETVLKPRTQAPAPQAAKKRVLFVCIGNSCRSQMAEAFARAYGADILEVRSAGLSPATMIAPLTKQTMEERNLNVDGQFPKALDLVKREPFDVAVNMSGYPITVPNARVLTWVVPDPIGQKESVYRSVASQIEGLVMRLILDLRAGRVPG
jgi:arsenate reductase (thioredoxin)